MEMRFNRNVSSESKGRLSLQKKIAESSRQAIRPKQVPDFTHFMKDRSFGTVNTCEKAYSNLGGGGLKDDNEEDFDASRESNNSRLTQEWLEEAKRMVASAPFRCDSPSRLVGSPRFAVSQPGLSALKLDRRDPLSRSARRQREVNSFSGEILSKSSKHSRNNSEALNPTPHAADISPASAVHKWFSNILKYPNTTPPPPSASAPTPTIANPNPTATTFPSRQSTHRKSRFHNNPNADQPQGIQTQPSKQTTTPAPPLPATQLLSPPKHPIKSSHRRPISSTKCSVPDNRVLSPPRKLVESAHGRSISSSTCSIDRNLKNPIGNVNVQLKDKYYGGGELNGFLKEQRIKIGRILKGEVKGKAKIVLSGPSNSTSSMVAAICYAWLLVNRIGTYKDRVEGDGSEVAVVPVMNVRRGKMWKQRQAAWLFHHVGVDATALIFSDEVDLETLMMAKQQLSILVVGQDTCITNGKVGSRCTILTDCYCKDAYDLLQTPSLKKLLLAGILLDTQNLDVSAKLSMSRDAEAVQLLSVGCAPNFGNDLYDQLMQDQRDGNFFEALRHNYGKPPNESSLDSRAPVEHRISDKKSYHESIVRNSGSLDSRPPVEHRISEKKSYHEAIVQNSVERKPLPTQATGAATSQASDASHGNNNFFLARWLGFGKG